MQIDWNRFFGTWYERSKSDNIPFEANLTSVVAQYSLDTNGEIKVVNSGYNSKTGKTSSVQGRAIIKGPNALRVSFLPRWLDWLQPQKANYVIESTDYDNYATITSDRYKWILIRSVNG